MVSKWYEIETRNSLDNALIKGSPIGSDNEDSTQETQVVGSAAGMYMYMYIHVDTHTLLELHVLL